MMVHDPVANFIVVVPAAEPPPGFGCLPAVRQVSLTSAIVHHSPFNAS